MTGVSIDLLNLQDSESLSDILRDEITQLRAWRLRLHSSQNLESIKEEMKRRADEIETRLAELDLLNLFPAEEN